MPLYNFGSGGGDIMGGVAGIADSSGKYTFYNDLQSAINTATAGQVVEVFADVDQISDVTLTLKDEVDINLIGHTYKLSFNSNTNAVTIPSNASMTIYNGKIERSNSTGAATSSCAINILSGTTVLNLDSVIVKSNGLTLYGYGEINGGTFINTSLVSYGFLYIGTIRNAKIRNVSQSRLSNAGRAYNCSFYSSSSVALHLWSGYAYNCVAYSDGGAGLLINNNARAYNCSAYSTSSYAIDGSASNVHAFNCTGESTANFGGYFTQANAKIQGCTFRSTVNYGVSLSNGATAYNCVIESAGSQGTRLVGDSKLFNSVSKCLWDNVAGHGVICINATTNDFEIYNNTLEVTNAGANCINSAVVTNYGKWGQNTFKGAATPVSTANPNQQTNTEDSFGNILIG